MNKRFAKFSRGIELPDLETPGSGAKNSIREFTVTAPATATSLKRIAVSSKLFKSIVEAKSKPFKKASDEDFAAAIAKLKSRKA